MNTQVNSRPSVARAAALSVVVAGVASALGNTIVSLVAQALGADATVLLGLQPAPYVVLGFVGLLLAVVAWTFVRARAADPARVMRVLVPVVVVVSLVPNVLIGIAGMGWVGAVALMLMHVVVAVAGVLAFRRFLPLNA